MLDKPTTPSRRVAATRTLVERLQSQHLRARLLRMIDDHPGLHASGLCRATGEPWGTVQYHLSLLEKANLVSAVEEGRERHFFPPTVDPTRARLLALLEHGRCGDLVSYIRTHPGQRQVDICDATQLSRKTFRSHVQRLMDEGLVEARTGLQSSRYYPAAGMDALGPLGGPEL